MPYQYNPHKHYKIGLSKNPEVFLTQTEQLHLVRMREINPDDEINLVYDSRLLSEEAKIQLTNFCTKEVELFKQNINLIDIEKLLSIETLTEEEKKLKGIYEEQIKNLDNGGNLEVASQVLRWMSPIYKLGTYSDFDVVPSTKGLEEEISVEKPILIDVGTDGYNSNSSYEQIIANPHVMAIVDHDEAIEEIKKIQNNLIAGYDNPREFIETFKKTAKANFRKLFLFGDFSFFRSRFKNSLEEMEIEYTAKALDIYKAYQLTIIEYAQEVLNQKGIRGIELIAPESIILKAASAKRQELQKSIGIWGWLTLPIQKYKHIKELLSIKDDSLFLKAVHEERRTFLLKKFNQLTTGSTPITLALFGKVFGTPKEISESKVYSFEWYGLNDAFKSTNNLSFDKPKQLKQMQAKKMIDLTLQEPSQKEVQSKVGQVRVFNLMFQQQYRRRKSQAETFIPEQMKILHNEINDKIANIRNQLGSHLGFYRNKSRLLKVDALLSLERCFKENQFDTVACKAALKYIKDDSNLKSIFASFGKSETKEIIEKLTLVCRRIHFYGLHKNGPINLSKASSSAHPVDSSNPFEKSTNPFDSENEAENRSASPAHSSV